MSYWICCEMLTGYGNKAKETRSFHDAMLPFRIKMFTLSILVVVQGRPRNHVTTRRRDVKVRLEHLRTPFFAHTKTLSNA